jgi:catechol 2,3-dioxygenase-like lactoylglutathione lyase family enzyme
MIKGFAHVCLGALDLAAVERFYCEGIGLKKAFDFVNKGGVTGFYLEVAPGNFIEVFKQDIIDPQARSPMLHFCIEVDDIDQVGQRLIAKGYEASDKSMGPDFSWQMWTKDPSGVGIEFHQYTDKSCQRTYENCVLE